MISIHKNLLEFQRPSEHSTYSPSSMDRIVGCPFSIQASKDIPNITSKYAEEGTIAHSVCEALFAKEYYDIDFPVDLSMKLSMLDDRGEEMLSSARLYVDVISSWLKGEQSDIGKVIYYGLEIGVPIFPEKGCFGTADCLIVGEKGAVIIDFKYGKGKAVSANSLQLRTYASGVHRYLNNIPDDYKYYSVVVQPRISLSPIQWNYTIADMNEHLASIWDAISKSERTDLSPCEGSWCFFCPANKTHDPYKKCPAIKGKALKAAQEDFGKFLADMNTPVSSLSEENKKRDEALVKIISLIPILTKIANDGIDEFTYRMEQGESIPHLQLVESIGNRKWKHSEESDMMLELKAKFPELKEFTKTITKLMTVTEIEKKVGKGKLEDLTVRPITKKLKVMDEEVQRILGELSAYSNNVLTNTDDLI